MSNTLLINLSDNIIQNEKPLRLMFFGGVFLILALWEIYTPARALLVSKKIRWLNNLGLILINTRKD